MKRAVSYVLDHSESIDMQIKKIALFLLNQCLRKKTGFAARCPQLIGLFLLTPSLRAGYEKDSETPLITF